MADSGAVLDAGMSHGAGSVPVLTWVTVTAGRGQTTNSHDKNGMSSDDGVIKVHNSHKYFTVKNNYISSA